MSKILINALGRSGLILLIPLLADAGELRKEYGGHAKLGLTGQSYPDDSVFRDLIGSSNSLDGQGDLRLNLELRKNGWSADGNYQLVWLNGDSRGVFGNSPDDDRRWFDLTARIDSGSRSTLLHRLDRLWVGYSSEKSVVRFGRQALSWGNALFFAPMDLVNPFDPAAVDTEYKAGDDMLYVQYLRDNGADVQGAYVVRRELISGDLDADEATMALKYHSFVGDGELDVLVARHYGDTVVGLAASRGIGGAQWSADMVVTDTDLDTYVQFSTNLNYSWNRFGKNMSGVIEYHFNGFGQKADAYDPLSLALNPELVEKLTRGEMFTLGRHYLAGAVSIEVSPLWTVSPTLLGNIGDPSALFQLVTSYNMADNLTVLGSLNVPVGGNGTEYGGPDSRAPARYLSRGVGGFIQVAWYF